MKIELIGPGYIGRSSNVDASRLVNFMPELHAPGAKARMTLISTPGSSFWASAAGVIRGLHVANYVAAGNIPFLFVVSGNSLYAYDVNGTLYKSFLNVLSTTQGRVLMKNNGVTVGGVGGNQVMIVDGARGYIFNSSTEAFVDDGSFTGGGWPTAGANALEYIDGYFVISPKDSMNAYASDLYDGINWSALALTPIQAAPDTVQAIWNVQEQLFFVKQYTTEIFYNNGVSTVQGFPFSRMTGAVLDFGCGNAGGSVARQGNTLYMLGFKRVNDTSNFTGVMSVTNGTPTIISPQSITYQMQNWAPFYDVISYCYEQEGHSFYVVTSPTANQTFVYDASIPDPLSAWHERSSYVYDSPYRYNRHFSNSYAYFAGMHLVGDYATGNIYELDTSIVAEKVGSTGLSGPAGTTTTQYPLISERTFQILADKEGMLRTIRINRLIVDAEGGTSSIAGSAALSFSADGGHTFSMDYPAEICRPGVYGSRMVWRRLGTFQYGVIFRVTVSDPVRRILIGAYLD